VKNLLQLAAPSERVSRPRQLREPVEEIDFGNVTAHFLNHEVTVDGNPVPVTPKQLKLLRYFVENPNRVISRSELLSEVWEISGNLQTRAVDQTVAQLRKIIEPDSASPVHLLTIRDAGYRFLLQPERGAVDASRIEGGDAGEGGDACAAQDDDVAEGDGSADDASADGADASGA
jgi:two-component system OmpR family response regulator